VTTKLNIKDIIKSIKIDKVKKVEPKSLSSHSVRDMRQEAIDMGSYGAKTSFQEPGE